MALTNYQKKLRYLARKRGEVVEPIPHRSGYHQSPEHIAKRIRSGPEHHAWKGDDVLPRSARARASRLYRDIGPCSKCGSLESERHHINRDPADNRPENIAILCHACHMFEHRGPEFLKKNR